MIIDGKIWKFDERSPMQGLKHESSPPREQPWLLEKQKLMHLDHFGSVASIEEKTCMGWGMKLSILHQLPTTA